MFQLAGAEHGAGALGPGWNSSQPGRKPLLGPQRRSTSSPLPVVVVLCVCLQLLVVELGSLPPSLVVEPFVELAFLPSVLAVVSLQPLVCGFPLHSSLVQLSLTKILEVQLLRLQLRFV